MRRQLFPELTRRSPRIVGHSARVVRVDRIAEGRTKIVEVDVWPYDHSKPHVTTALNAWVRATGGTPIRLLDLKTSPRPGVWTATLRVFYREVTVSRRTG